MRGLLLLTLAILTPLTASATVAPPRGDPKAPIQLVTFAPPPAQIACGQGSVRLIEGAPFAPNAWQGSLISEDPPLMEPLPPTSEVYTFSVNAEGRVMDLKRKAELGGRIAWSTEDQAAVIASWRFAPGAAAKNCAVDLAPNYIPIAEASPAQLFQSLANNRSPAPILRQALEAGADCTGRRRPQTIVYPDQRPFDDKTVDPAWAGLRYDIDADGAVRNVRVVAQHGEAAFADAAASAVAEARFFPGTPRTGCYLAFKAIPKATPPLPRPDGATFERPGDDCKVTREALNVPEIKYYPPTFSKHRVGGWAILRFDVAPWGQVGAIKVLASQPDETFGIHARMLLQSARPKPPASGYRGCIVPMIYAIPPMPQDDY